MALQAGVDTEGNPIYTLVNGAQEVEVSTGTGMVAWSSGAWSLVVFQLAEIKPSAWTFEAAAHWISQADGFVSFDIGTLPYYAWQERAITGRAFTCRDVYLAAPIHWWTESGGEITQHSGTIQDWITAGSPVFAKTSGLPGRLGIPNY